MTVKSGAQSGAVTLIQRFGSALNLNPHFHMLYLNGVYDAKGYFWPVKPPTCEDLDVIAHTIARRVSRFLEKAGYLVRDAESEYLDLMQDEEDAKVVYVNIAIVITGYEHNSHTNHLGAGGIGTMGRIRN